MAISYDNNVDQRNHVVVVVRFCEREYVNGTFCEREYVKGSVRENMYM